jgi:hypothetical protein
VVGADARTQGRVATSCGGVGPVVSRVAAVENLMRSFRAAATAPPPRYSSHLIVAGVADRGMR